MRPDASDKKWSSCRPPFREIKIEKQFKFYGMYREPSNLFIKFMLEEPLSEEARTRSPVREAFINS